ncbi:hypothetical protein O3M35_001135 [Rhynocoris fuscipes]|uniref:Dynein axonemal intermediate chain 4 n=1 Tax=Rhynocoris fuscipes TaxID=488301 RepID=A0AAW1DQ86_9HEMI
MHYDLLRPQIEKIVTKKPHQFEDPRLIQPDYEDISTCVLDSPEFYLVFHSIEKLLEANYYRNYHRIYNNPSYLHDLPKDQKLALIFTFKQPKKLKPKQDCEVTSIAWHPLYKYLIGVGYGKMHLEKNARGMFCIWNIKNPSYPERMYNFKHPVTSFSFCKVYPYAVALTFYNGQMMIINILARKLINMCDNTNFMKDYMQITHITWFKGEEGDYYPVTSSKSGDMYKFKVDNFLYPDLLLDLPRKYGETKGIEQCMRIFSGDENAKPLKIGISTFTQHPKNYLLYLVGTDDGYVHICSKWFSMKDTDVFAAHEGPITSIEFHHETDKLFLTSGNDYYVRVWAYLIYTPLMCFTTKKEIVRYAKWASFNIMQIVAMGEIYLDIWDIRRINNSVPITTYENTERSNNLIFNVSPFGPHVLLGDEKGDVHLLIYNYTKYEPPFKMQILARALRNHVKCRDPDLWRQVEQLIPEFKVKNVKDDPIDILEESDE